MMGNDFDTRPADIYTAIGPCIRDCCYEVGSEVAAQFQPFFPEWDAVNEKRNLDLPGTNRRQMESAGVDKQRIFDCCLCTTCQSAQFYSYRREPENPGRMTAAICRLA